MTDKLTLNDIREQIQEDLLTLIGEFIPDHPGKDEMGDAACDIIVKNFKKIKEE